RQNARDVQGTTASIRERGARFMIDYWGRAIVDLAYLLSSILFVLAIWRLSTPKTARLGNTLAMGGMSLAIFVTFFHDYIEKNYVWIVLAIIVGGAPGYFMAKRVQMTAMPQMVAIFNGLSGAAAAFIGVSEALGSTSLGLGSFTSVL